VAFAAERSGASGEVDGLLADLLLTELQDRKAGELSVGEGKRLELARVLAVHPAVLLLDEPLAGLSPEAARHLSDVIERASGDGAAVVWVEHGPATAGPASQVLVLEDGRIRFLGSSPDWEAAHAAPSS
jgi:ABC-type branched-subunit amino acid transport system ATPase component